MLPSLSPLAVINRVLQILPRNGWRMLAVMVLFNLIPMEALEMALARPLFADLLGAQTDATVRSMLVMCAAYVCSYLGYFLAKLAALDDLDQYRRPFSRLVQVGLGRFLRACWLIMPVAVAGSQLADRFGFLAGIPSYILLIVFLNHYAVARGTLKESAAVSVRVFKRHAPALVINGLLVYCVTYGAHKGYNYFYAHWSELVPSRIVAGGLGMVFITLADTLFAGWSVALYWSLRGQFESQSQRAAAVFE